MGHGTHLVKVRSLRFGTADVWCHRTGRFRVDGSQTSESLEAFFFRIMRTNKNRTVRLVCKSHRSTHCPVSVNIEKSGKINTLTGLHNHRPDSQGYGVDFREARTNWLSNIRENPTEEPEVVVLDGRRKWSRPVASTVVLERHFRTARRHAGKV